MQMRVDRLREVLQLAQPLIPKKTTLPVLKNILLKDGKALATNLDVSLAVDLPEADEECLIPHESVLSLLKYVMGTEILTITSSKKEGLNFSWDDGNGRASYDAVDPREYPSIPLGVEAKARGILDGERLITALVSVAKYCSRDSSRPVLNGVVLTFGETMELAAGDGFRMAYHILPLPFPSEEKAIVPGDFVDILAEIWRKSPPAPASGDTLVSQVMGRRPLELALSSGALSASFGRVTLVSKLIEGTAPNFSQLVPKEPSHHVLVFAPDLERAVLRVKRVANEASDIVRLLWEEGRMTVSAKGKDSGSIQATVPVQITGEPSRIAFNVNYLVSYLKGRQGMVKMSVTDRQAPAIFRNGAGSPLIVIMPMFAQWDDEPPAPEPGPPAPSSEESAEATEEEPETETEEVTDEVTEEPTDEVVEAKPKKKPRKRK